MRDPLPQWMRFALLAGITASCPAGADPRIPTVPSPSAPKPPRVIEVHGHRGARAERPENTMAAFAYAIEAGADVLEMDVVVTADDVLVVHHDLEIDPARCRLRDGSPIPPGRAVRAMTLAQILELDCGSLPHPDFPRQVLVPGEGVPTLAAVLQWILARPDAATRPVRLNIETKSLPSRPELAPEPDAFAALLVQALRASGTTSIATVQSFDHRVLNAIHRLSPDLPLAALTHRSLPDLVAVARAANAGTLSPHIDWITRKDALAASAAGLRIVPWTANDPATWDRLIDLGVDGIITDDPAGLRRHLRQRAGSMPTPGP